MPAFRTALRAAATALALACGAALAAVPLPEAVRSALDAAGVPIDAFAAAATPLGHRARGFSHRAEVPMQPGSTMKLVTSIVALDKLGPNHRGFTELRSAAAIDRGVLRGDLVIKGGADPELGVAQFWALLMELREQGIAEIAGDVIVDRHLFRPARMDLGLPPFDEAPEFAYNVIPDALNLAGALMPIEIASTAAGAVQARAVPSLAGIEFASAMTPSERRCEDWDDDWQPARIVPNGTITRIELRGGFPRACLRRTELQLIDRQQLTEALFRSLWAGLGGRFAGRVVEGPAPATTTLLARRQSRPWGELLRPLNKSSDNALTRILFLSLGLDLTAADAGATTAELAAREVKRWFATQRIDAPGLVLDNGSGLSRSERIAPATLAAMLERAWRGPNASDLMMSLPTAGVDGTMRNRLKASPAAGWARLKTGTLANVAALAGYVNDADGKPWAVAMMVNHPNAAKARPALDAFVDHVARGGLAVTARPGSGVGPLGDGP